MKTHNSASNWPTEMKEDNLIYYEVHAEKTDGFTFQKVGVSSHDTLFTFSACSTVH